MKTVEETKTGLPSYEPEWPQKADKKHEPAVGRKTWASERLDRMLQSSIWDNAWRGFQGYDSPLAG